MALVMLPCDLPWWPTLGRHLKQIADSKDAAEFVDGMLKIHNMCNVGLDPDEPDRPDQTLFEGLQHFLEEVLSAEERDHFLGHTGPNMVRRALDLKNLKPLNGLHFSLQQQGDRVEFERPFIASVIAHAFFSTYPKRTAKTHPTLQDCNFSTFFKHLDQKCQQAKLRSIWRYFDEIELDTAPTEKVIVSREVMTGKEWLTIEDWLECGLPLCPLAVRHEGRLERSEQSALRVCFANSRLGGNVLDEGSSMESVQFCTCPELLAVLLSVEALEDNEALLVENVLNVSRITEPRLRAVLEPVNCSVLLTVCCMDAENYRRLPLSQFEEDNVLRELNKALLAFRQGRWSASTPVRGRDTRPEHEHHQRRLSPIGESFSSTQSETRKTEAPRQMPRGRAAGRGRSTSPRPTMPPSTAMTRRGRFIVLGSSGECLPVSRRKVMTGGLGKHPSSYSSCQSDGSDSDEFHSARSSLSGDSDSDGERGDARRYSAQLDTPERRSTFAQRLREALRRERVSSGSSESSYAVGITVAGTGLGEDDIRLRRGGSRGFMLEDSVDASMDKSMDKSIDKQSVDCYSARREARKHQAATRRPGALVSRRDTADSSRYSFSTDCSSDVDEACDQLGRWLDDPAPSGSPGSPALPGSVVEADRRDVAVVRFASRLLKRTLSDSFAGVQLSGSGSGEREEAPPGAPEPVSPTAADGEVDKLRRSLKLAQFARSMSLELAKHKHRLASQLVSQIGASLARGDSTGIRPVASGNWGCGSERAGDPQLKLIIQWLAASVAGSPRLVYYTCSHHKLVKLDTVCRVVLDRHWTVGELANAALRFAQTCLDSPSPPHTSMALFDALLGMDRSVLSESR